MVHHGYIKANMNIVYTLHAVQSLSCTKYKLHAQFTVENVISAIFLKIQLTLSMKHDQGIYLCFII